MCGVVALFRRDGAPVDAEQLLVMRDLMEHRGPDDAGIFVDGPVGVGHRRLEIIDLAGGHQPMANARGTVQVVFNGEIYNYRELRARLQGLGMALRTKSDTEAIVGLYDHYGLDGIQHLRGMFAFVLWDAERRRLVAARDRVGIKPLYVLRRGPLVALASEVKAFLPLVEWQPEVRPEALAEYLTYRNLAGTGTFFRDVERLPPGEIAVFSAEGERRKRYWTLPMPVSEPDHSRPAAAWADEFEALLGEVVQQHMVSDVPLGTFLSGGVDSSIVTALARPAAEGRLHTFSVGFEEGEFDERPFSHAVAERLGTVHESMVISAGEYADWLARAVWHADEPLSHPHMVHFHYLSRFAKERVTVVLTGEGADELFAGYPRYRALRALERTPLPIPFAAPLARFAGNRLPGRAGLRMRALFAGGSELRLEGLAAFVDPSEVGVMLPGLPEPGPREADPQGRRRLLARGLHLDQQTYLDVLLHRLDKMTMSAALEARVPFLDHRVIEFAARVPPNLKLAGFETKAIVKAVARRHVPAEVIDRPKKGFGVPIAAWLRPGGPLAPFGELLLESNARVAGWVDRKRLRQVLEAHRAGTADHAELLWGMLNLELWHRTVLKSVRSRDRRRVTATARVAGRPA